MTTSGNILQAAPHGRCAPSPRPSRGEGWGEGALSTHSHSRRVPLTRIASAMRSDLSPQAGRGKVSPAIIASAAKQSMPQRYERMDCFAEPVIGRRFAPPRWLAMTMLVQILRRRPRLDRRDLQGDVAAVDAGLRE